MSLSHGRVRLIGLVLIACGGALLMFGRGSVTSEIGGVPVSVPLDFPLLLGGLLLMVDPALAGTVLSVLASVLPGAIGDRIRDYVNDRHFGPTTIPAITEPARPTQLVAQLNDRIAMANRELIVRNGRVGALVLLAMVTTISSPFLVSRMLAVHDKHAFYEALIAAIELERVRPSGSDHYHLVLNSPVRQALREEPVTAEICEILGGLYARHEPLAGGSSGTAEQPGAESFVLRVREQYERLRKEDSRSPMHPFLKTEALQPLLSRREPEVAAVALLLLKGLVCLEYGRQGAEDEPYFRALQYLRAAARLKALRSSPAGYNGMGVAFSYLARCHESYSQWIEGQRQRDPSVIGDCLFGDDEPYDLLTLAGEALARFMHEALRGGGSCADPAV